MTDKEIKVGDKVRYTGESKVDLTHGNAYNVIAIHNGEIVDVFDDVGDENAFYIRECELVEATPTLWRDMTDAEKGALLLAHHEGKALQMLIGDEWFDRIGIFADNVAYRIKPEPKKPREVWIVDGAHVYEDEAVARQDMADFRSTDIAMFREVLDD